MSGEEFPCYFEPVCLKCGKSMGRVSCIGPGWMSDGNVRCSSCGGDFQWEIRGDNVVLTIRSSFGGESFQRREASFRILEKADPEKQKREKEQQERERKAKEERERQERERKEREERERQEQEQKAKKERDLRIQALGATLSFTPCEDVVDIDGNRYRTVRIGNQIWMAENLKVTKYNDGTPIKQEGEEEYEVSEDYSEDEEYTVKILGIVPVRKVRQVSKTRMVKKTRKVDWKSLGERKDGALCHYDNKAENGEKYGALYNWHAVNTGKLAPVGWHVPTDQEWEELSNYCGGKDVAGKFLKTDKDWNGNNKSGFSAVPAGARNYDGSFYNVGSYAYVWSSSEFDAGLAWYRYLSSGNVDLHRGYNDKKNGYSVRCLKDGP